jgi:DNA primase catalytic subunit
MEFKSVEDRRIIENRIQISNTSVQMRLYYKYIYPFNVIKNMLGTINQREFCLVTKSQYYKRYLSFEYIVSIRKDSTTINDLQPLQNTYCRFQTGGVYKQGTILAPRITSSKDEVEQDFVLDIDMNDYKDIKDCGCECICERC